MAHGQDGDGGGDGDGDEDGDGEGELSARVVLVPSSPSSLLEDGSRKPGCRARISEKIGLHVSPFSGCAITSPDFCVWILQPVPTGGSSVRVVPKPLQLVRQSSNRVVENRAIEG